VTTASQSKSQTLFGSRTLCALLATTGSYLVLTEWGDSDVPVVPLMYRLVEQLRVQYAVCGIRRKISPHEHQNEGDPEVGPSILVHIEVHASAVTAVRVEVVGGHSKAHARPPECV
jgi:hypothetical protein